jgi:uncharacterized RDD family membrane protein YckC
MACLNHPGVAIPLVRCAGCLQNLCRACVEPDEQFFYCARCHPSLVVKAPPAPSRAPEKASLFEPTFNGAPAAPGGTLLASLPRRGLAFVIDGLVVGLALRLLLSGMSDQVSIVVLMFVMPTIYEAVFLQHMGQTIGKSLLGVQVVSNDGSPMSGVQALGRSVLKVMQLSCCGLTLLSVLLTKERRGLHDLAAGTRVVRAGEPASTEAGD